MTYKISFPLIILLLLILASCSSQEITKDAKKINKEKLPFLKDKKEAHRYGGWYCPDNFGFVPVDIQKIDEVPAIADRLPTEEELKDNKSLIAVDIDKYPDARALKMDLPRVARISSERKGTSELIIVIQAIIVSEDTIVGYRFPNGGNGSAWLSDVRFLNEDEVASYGSQPFYYSRSKLKASKEDIWNAMRTTDFFKQLGDKFGEREFFSSDWTSDSEVQLNIDIDGEKADGYVATVFGNAYLHIDYYRNGFHYSEKLLMIENHEDRTTELFFACGPFPKNFETNKEKWESWLEEVENLSKSN